MNVLSRRSKNYLILILGIYFQFFLLGCNTYFTSSFSSNTNLSAPSGLSFANPLSSPGMIATPTLAVSGVQSGATVRLFSNSTCTAEVASGLASTTSIDLTVASPLANGTYVFYAQQSDSTRTSPCSTVSLEYTLTTGPFIQSVSSSTADGGYKATQSVSIQITFSESVTVTGTPRLLLETGTTDRYATYASGSGTSSLTFTYTVQAGDTTSDLQYQSTSALDLNGGTLKNGSGDNALLILPTLASTQSLAGSKAIVIDTTGPVIAAPLVDGTVHVSSTASSNLSWAAAVDGSGVSYYELAIGTSSGGTQTLGWTNIGNVTSYQRTGLTLVDGTTYYPSLRAVDSLGNVGSVLTGDGWIANAAVPTVINVTSSTANGSYGLGQSISIQITFLENVTVTGSPRLRLETGSTDQYASYASGSGTNILTFTYTVQAGDASTDLQYESTSALELNGGTIRDSLGSDADLTLPGLATAPSLAGGKALVIETTPPTAPTSFSDGASTTDPSRTPWLSWTASTDASGIARYEIAVGTSSGATDVLTWTSVGNVTGTTGNSLTLTTETTYYVSARAIDNAGNISSVVNGDGFLSTKFGWKQMAYLKAPNAEAGDLFGVRVAIDGDTAVVGARGEASNQTTITNGTTASADNTAATAGAAYVFKRSGDTWTAEAYLKASNAEGGDWFGVSVDIHGDTIVVGSTREDSNQTTITNGSAGSSNNSYSSAGAAYVFKRTGTTWTEEAYLKASNADPNDQYGRSVAIHQDTIVVGAVAEDSSQTTITNGTGSSSDNSFLDTGAAYVYKRTGSTWAQEAYLKASNGTGQDYFGVSADVEGDTVVVGAYGENSNQTTITNGTIAAGDTSAVSSGAAYIFKRSGATWSQEAYLKAPNAEGTDNFGFSVAIANDTVIVGSCLEDSNQATITNGTIASSDNSFTDAGAAYIFKRTGTTWVQEAYLKAPNVNSLNYFGYHVAIDGDVAIVGAYLESSSRTTILNQASVSPNFGASSSGAVYVYKRTGNSWAHEAYLKASNAEANDNFAAAVAISGDTIISGAPFEDSNQTSIINSTTASSDNSAASAGAAYIYKVNRQPAWQQLAYAKAPNADAGDYYAFNVAISEDTAAVGAWMESSNDTAITNGATASSNNSAFGAGAVYVLKRSGSTWAQEAFLKAPNSQGGDSFGLSVAVDGDTIVVGAPGEDSSTSSITNGATAPSNEFGSSVGGVYVFKRNGLTWTQEAFIKPSNAGSFDYFGTWVDVSGDTIVVGAYGEDSNQTTITNGATAPADNSINTSGAAFVYKRTGTTWAQEAYLKAPNPGNGDEYGCGVAIDGDTIVVGSYSEDSNQTTITNGATASADNSASNAGAGYVYKRVGSTWANEAYLKASNADANDAFGLSVAIHDDTIVVGAYGESSNQTTIDSGTTASSNNSAAYAGAAYVFKRTGSTWAQEAYLKASNAGASDEFGFNVAIFGNRIVVGARAEDSNQVTITNGTTASADNSATDAGGAYVFKRSGTTWVQEAYLKAPNADTGDEFGNVVSISRETIIVGAPNEDSNETTITNGTTASSNNSAATAGAAYIFKTP